MVAAEKEKLICNFRIRVCWVGNRFKTAAGIRLHGIVRQIETWTPGQMQISISKLILAKSEESLTSHHALFDLKQASVLSLLPGPFGA